MVSETDANNHSSPAGLCEKLSESVEAMLESAIQLREALINRESEQIWEILADQEEKSEYLEKYTELWHQTFGDMDFPEDHEIHDQRADIRNRLSRLQIIERVNASLARNYLGTIQKAIDDGMGDAKKGNKYNHHGRKGQAYKSFFVRQKG